jgi:hypothetical protein
MRFIGNPAIPLAAVLAALALPVAASAADYGGGYEQPDYAAPDYGEPAEPPYPQAVYPQAQGYEPVYAPPGAVFVEPPPVYVAPPVYYPRPVVVAPIVRPYPVLGAYPVARPYYVGRPYRGYPRRW